MSTSKQPRADLTGFHRWVIHPDSYVVTRNKYGIIVGPNIPLTDANILLEGWSKENETSEMIIDTAIAQHINAAFVVATKENAFLWRKELGICVPEENK